MATQRVIPIEEENIPAQSIVITYSNGVYSASPVGCIIQGSGQQGVSFSNTSGQTVAINFVQDPVNPNQKVFNDIPSLPGTGLPSPQMPQVSNGSANYNIVVGDVTYGPFAIQVGSGPLNVLISMGSGQSINVTPPTFVVPAYNNVLQIAGTVNVVADNVNNDYSIGWPGGVDPFNPCLTAPDTGVHGDTNTTVVKSYQFTVSSPTPKQGGNGGGTVKIQGT